MQVLVSIQGLILVAKPYFNEAGYEKQTGSAEGELNAVLYNEQTFLLTVRSAMHLVTKPPSGFEALIKASCRWTKHVQSSREIKKYMSQS